jgi:MFS family permease
MSSLPSQVLRTASETLVALRQRTDEFIGGPPDPAADADLPDGLSAPDARKGRKMMWLDGLVTNISESFVLNFVNPYALALGATNVQVGWLSALTNLAGALGQLPGARLDERGISRKLVVIVCGGGIARLLLIAMALVPLVFGGGAAIYAFIALIALRSFLNNLGVPAWSALVADIAPASIRGRYFASRNIALAVAALLFTPLAGRLAEVLGLPLGYQASFLVAGLIGFAATAIFARIPEPPRARPAATAQAARPHSAWTALRTHPEFAWFAAVAFIWNLGIMVAGPFFSVYLVRNLGASPTQIGLLAAIHSFAAIFGQRLWGRLTDRRGPEWVVLVAGWSIPLIPVLYALVPNPWLLLPVEALSGFAWAGYGLANFNLLLDLTPVEQRTRYIALYQIAVFSAAFIGPLIGSALANSVGIIGLFWISAAGRVVAALIFMLTIYSTRRRAHRTSA